MNIQQQLFSEFGDQFDGSEDSGLGRAISRITVEGLFGQFNYTLPEPDRVTDVSKVLILYGDNGSGKTTMLRALFHLLSPANNRGHRTALASVPFTRLEVDLLGGGRIGAYRESNLVGSYVIRGQLDGREIRVDYAYGGDKGGFGSEEQEMEFLTFVRVLNCTVYLLSADRTIMCDILPVAPEEFGRSLILEQSRYSANESLARYMMDRTEHLQRNAPLLRAIQLANDWIRRQALRATTRGTENANTIYAEIIKRLAHYPDSPSEVAGAGQLATTLKELSTRNAEFARFQFTSPLQVEDILDVLQRVDGRTAAVIGNVLGALIDGTRARLDALEGLQKTVASFVENLNAFYTMKTVTFDVADGLKIVQPNGTPLDPSLLSSGEQQLLLMFCHIVLPRRGQSLFMIDEPELSLNIKWQRKLINALQDIVQSAKVQFLFASHSMEFLSEHIDHVVELIPRHASDSTPPVSGVASGPSNNS